MSKRGINHGAEQFAPLVKPVRIKYEALKGCEVDSLLLGKIAEYSDYVERYTGNKPTPGEIVSAGLEELFKLDKGFSNWLEEKQPASEQPQKLAATSLHPHPVRAKANGES
jgi:hypothetical protein